METRAQRKQRENNPTCGNEIRKLKVVLKRLTTQELQIHGVSIEYNITSDICFINLILLYEFRYKFMRKSRTSKQNQWHASS